MTNTSSRSHSKLNGTSNIKIKIIILNIRSLKHNTNLIIDLLLTFIPDIVAITEMLISNDDSPIFSQLK